MIPTAPTTQEFDDEMKEYDGMNEDLEMEEISQCLEKTAMVLLGHPEKENEDNSGNDGTTLAVEDIGGTGTKFSRFTFVSFHLS